MDRSQCLPGSTWLALLGVSPGHNYSISDVRAAADTAKWQAQANADAAAEARRAAPMQQPQALQENAQAQPTAPAFDPLAAGRSQVNAAIGAQTAPVEDRGAMWANIHAQQQQNRLAAYASILGTPVEPAKPPQRAGIPALGGPGGGSMATPMSMGQAINIMTGQRVF